MIWRSPSSGNGWFRLLTILSFSLFLSCGGNKVLPEWAKPGTVAIHWPELDGKIKDFTGREARAVATAIRSHLLVEIPLSWKLEAFPRDAISDPWVQLKTQIYHWEKFYPPGMGQGRSVTSGDYVYGLRMVLTDPSGKVLWSKSRREHVSMKRREKGRKKAKLPWDINSASRKAVRKLLDRCPLALRSQESEKTPETP